MNATLALVALALLGLVGSAPAAALSPARTASELRDQLRPVRLVSGALVVDLDTGERIFSSRAGTKRVPASVEKLYTTSTALLRLGPGARLQTEVRAVTPLTLSGRLDGDLYLRGGGDPTLTSGGLRTLARTLVRKTGLSRVTGRVIGDDSAFDQLRGVPSSGYRISVDVQPLGALMVDRGRTGQARPYYQADPAAWAATRFAAALRAEGVKVAKQGQAGTAPPGALTLAARRSPSIARLVQLTNAPSDNYIAEMLLKAVAAQAGDGGSTRAGAALVRRTVADEFSVRPDVADGSGLSRENRTSPTQVVRLLQRVLERAEGQHLFDSLAVMGRTGTLERRLRASVARDRCRGKTGTLRDVSTLAGYCEAPGGERLAFALLMNQVSPTGARQIQDRMVSLIARYTP